MNIKGSGSIRYLLLAMTVFVCLTAAIPVFAGGNITPDAALLNYYSEINAGQYQLAYQQWHAPSQTYDQFVAGYSTTTHVDAYFGGFRPDYAADPSGNISNTLRGAIPGVLVGTHTDGSKAMYYGCYTLYYDGLIPTQWQILSGNFVQGSGITTTQTIQFWLNQADCFNYNTLSGDQHPQLALVDYYDKVNAKDFNSAYASWTTPFQSFADFSAGYATTTDVVPFTGRVCNNGTSAEVNVVLFGYHTDGSLSAYGGSITLAYDVSRARHWGITGASLNPIDISGNVPTHTQFFATLVGACAGMALPAPTAAPNCFATNTAGTPLDITSQSNAVIATLNAGQSLPLAGALYNGAAPWRFGSLVVILPTGQIGYTNPTVATVNQACVNLPVVPG